MGLLTTKVNLPQHPKIKGEGEADFSALPREPSPVGLAGPEVGAGDPPGDRVAPARPPPPVAPAPGTGGQKHRVPGTPSTKPPVSQLLLI